MQKRLADVLEQRGDNYILPFYWQHGDTAELIAEGMEKIKESGIGAVCVEARPHPDYVGPQWWHDIDLILAKAKELDMKVWILDDSHFPTGRCAGKLPEDSPHRKWLLTHYCIDAIGPLHDHSFIIQMGEEDTFVGAVAARRDPKEDYHIEDLVDISAYAHGDVLEWDVPEGRWTITIMKATYQHTARQNYANLIDKDAVRFFLDTVYEPHYAHYKDDFGKTLLGFFSDEPEFGNVYRDIFCPDGIYIGVPQIPLPWCNELAQTLQAQWGDAYYCNLALLWNETDRDKTKTNVTGKVRKDYMEALTHLYDQNFCQQVGDWCRAHGVEYIGHIIEDGRLGMGVGHFFRGLWGEDMSGIDVVLCSVMPEMDEANYYRLSQNQVTGSPFSHYGLGKIGASLAHIDPKKKGRAMCEVFGAFGWAEGLKLMKWLLDHMLVRGINYYVPHAFTMKDFPDPDAPPHFYARGNNPQFPYFKNLMEYLNRICHLTNGGVHCANIGVLYTMDLEWMVHDTMSFPIVTRPLMRNQIDFDILPIDHVTTSKLEGNALLTGAPIYDGDTCIGQEKIDVLVIPESPCFDRAFAEWCMKSIEQGFRIICINHLPIIMEPDGTLTTWKTNLPEIVALDEIVNAVKEIPTDCIFTANHPYLRHYHYQHADSEYYLFFNEAISEAIETTVTLSVPTGASVVQFDAWENRLVSVPWDANTNELTLSLQPYEMKIIFVGNVGDTAVHQLPQCTGVTQELAPTWDVSLKKANESDFVTITPMETLKNITAHNMHKEFCGIIQYQAEIEVQDPKQWGYLDFGAVYETANLWVNGVEVGCKIVPPYQFEVRGLLKEGKNTITLQVANTVVHAVKDTFSVSLPLEPSGLLGPVSLVQAK